MAAINGVYSGFYFTGDTTQSHVDIIDFLGAPNQFFDIYRVPAYINKSYVANMDLHTFDNYRVNRVKLRTTKLPNAGLIVFNSGFSGSIWPNDNGAAINCLNTQALYFSSGYATVKSGSLTGHSSFYSAGVRTNGLRWIHVHSPHLYNFEMGSLILGNYSYEGGVGIGLFSTINTGSWSAMTTGAIYSYLNNTNTNFNVAKISPAEYGLRLTPSEFIDVQVYGKSGEFDSGYWTGEYLSGLGLSVSGSVIFAFDETWQDSVDNFAVESSSKNCMSLWGDLSRMFVLNGDLTRYDIKNQGGLLVKSGIIEHNQDPNEIGISSFDVGISTNNITYDALPDRMTLQCSGSENARPLQGALFSDSVGIDYYSLESDSFTGVGDNYYNGRYVNPDWIDNARFIDGSMAITPLTLATGAWVVDNSGKLIPNLRSLTGNFLTKSGDAIVKIVAENYGDIGILDTPSYNVDQWKANGILLNNQQKTFIASNWYDTGEAMPSGFVPNLLPIFYPATFNRNLILRSGEKYHAFRPVAHPYNAGPQDIFVEKDNIVGWSNIDAEDFGQLDSKYMAAGQLDYPDGVIYPFLTSNEAENIEVVIAIDSDFPTVDVKFDLVCRVGHYYVNGVVLGSVPSKVNEIDPWYISRHQSNDYDPTLPIYDDEITGSPPIGKSTCYWKLVLPAFNQKPTSHFLPFSIAINNIDFSINDGKNPLMLAVDSVDTGDGIVKPLNTYDVNGTEYPSIIGTGIGVDDVITKPLETNPLIVKFKSTYRQLIENKKNTWQETNRNPFYLVDGPFLYQYNQCIKGSEFFNPTVGCRPYESEYVFCHELGQLPTSCNDAELTVGKRGFGKSGDARFGTEEFPLLRRRFYWKVNKDEVVNGRNQCTKEISRGVSESACKYEDVSIYNRNCQYSNGLKFEIIGVRAYKTNQTFWKSRQFTFNPISAGVTGVFCSGHKFAEGDEVLLQTHNATSFPNYLFYVHENYLSGNSFALSVNEDTDNILSLASSPHVTLGALSGILYHKTLNSGTITGFASGNNVFVTAADVNAFAYNPLVNGSYISFTGVSGQEKVNVDSWKDYVVRNGEVSGAYYKFQLYRTKHEIDLVDEFLQPFDIRMKNGQTIAPLSVIFGANERNEFPRRSFKVEFLGFEAPAWCAENEENFYYKILRSTAAYEAISPTQKIEL